ncbi:PTS sugar transporter subunit IIA [Cellulomonas composti]|uniref:PTS glucose transporter subunit IIA n=1 Tax=Cellulomonas composti TaxID=266130 RepID=A0A511JD18_9CELL|nr:PTS glucose transporter subunit IIA [Cellulomonas composti]GEL95890.1 PTS glucose transporter subunit IIA [Cellulomonas composti]
MHAIPTAVLAPVAGLAVAMGDVPDPVFAQALVGPGMAIDPPRAAGVRVVAPVTGTIVKLHPHAFVLQSDEGRTVLVHLGIDTVRLRGEGFELFVAEGDHVEAGQHVVTWDPAAVAAGGRSPVCPVVALEALPEAIALLVEPGDPVTAGEPFLRWG